MQDVGHFEQCLVGRVLHQLPVELGLQLAFEEVELEDVEVPGLENEVQVLVSLVVDDVLSACSCVLVKYSLDDLNSILIVEEQL